MHKKRLNLLLFIILLFSLILLAPLSVAHTEETQVQTSDSTSWTSPTPYIIIVGVFLIIMTIFVIAFNDPIVIKNKKFFFWLMTIPVVLVSLYLASHTIYEISTSESRGPVHWHADYQVYACGQKLDLVDPQGLKNKIGSAIFHEHNDGRIHIEGTINKINDVSLKNYFTTVGGELEHGHLVYPTNEITYNYKDGDLCQDLTIGYLKVYINGKREEHFEDYLVYPDPNVPPGDCIIIQFDGTNEETTDIICDTWKLKGWTYDNYKRPSISVGEYTWQ